jgi:hypothetical protein
MRLRFPAVLSAAALVAPGWARLPAQTTQTAQQYYAAMRSVEHVGDVRRNATIRITDARQFQENTVPLDSLTRRLADSATAHGYRAGSSNANEDFALRPITVELVVSYLGQYQTESGGWGSKAIATVKMADPNQTTPNVEVPVNADTIYGRQGLFNRVSSQQRARWQADISARLAHAALAEVDKFTKAAGAAYRQFAVFGKAPATVADSDAVKRAVLDGLREGSARAWGLEVQSLTTMIDLADVTETTTSAGHGLVLYHAVDPQYSTLTSDGFYMVLVTAVTANPNSGARPRTP